jgi:hypothetical protein
MNKQAIITAFPTFLRPCRWQALRDYRRLPIAFLLALVVFVSCSDEEEPIWEQLTEQTVIFFMPWSTNMTPYFEQNIADFETAIAGGLLKNERVIVCISSTTSKQRLQRHPRLFRYHHLSPKP